MSQAPVEGGASSTAYLTGASHLNKRVNARSARDVEHCYADQSKPNETERGLRVVGGALYSFALNQNLDCRIVLPSTMPEVLFRCPNTGYHVQGWFGEDVSDCPTITPPIGRIKYPTAKTPNAESSWATASSCGKK